MKYQQTKPIRRAVVPGRACILVLGMHRSGTSALTRVLNLLGCALPSDLLGANYSNPEGHWESLRAIEINDSLLNALGRRWDDIRELPVDWLGRPETDIARQQIRAFVDREFSPYMLSVLKEPRLCHLAPLWIEVLHEAGIQARIVIPVRHPAEVAYSLARRDGIAVGRTHLLWMQHLLQAEAASRGELRVLCHFHELLADWRTQAARIGSALNLKWPSDNEQSAALIDEFLRPNLRHADARSGEDIGSKMTLPSLVSRLYAELGSKDDERAWTAIARASVKVAEASALYSPGITEIAQRLERSEHEASAANALLSSSIAERERRQQTTERIASHVEQNVARLQELSNQIRAHRSELQPAIDLQAQQLVQWRTETQLLLDRPDKAQRQLAELAESLQGQVREQREAAARVLERQDLLIASLSESLAAKELRINELGQSRAEDREFMRDLSAAAQERAARIDELERELAAAIEIRETHIAHQDHIIHLRDQVVVDLRTAMAGIEARAEGIEQGLSDAEREIAARGKRIAELSTEVAAANESIRQLLLSHSWRITRPLRKLSSLLSGKSNGELALPQARTGSDGYTPHAADAGATQVSASQLEAVPESFDDSEFDADFYLAQYPDIALAGVDPRKHYFEHGRAEGRRGTPPELPLAGGGVAFDPNKETVLVASHEASRTGAPVLSLNIVQELIGTYNVISCVLGEGPLVDTFRQESTLLLGPVRLRNDQFSAHCLVTKLLEKYPVKFAIVNSIESRALLEPLAKHGVPAVSLIHEFAAYTRPRHAFREAIFWAGETIFSTPITHENAVSEFPELSTHEFPILPQGRCRLLPSNEDEASREKEVLRIRNALRPGGESDDKVVILGAGFVQQRKGVDLFVKCAARVLQSDRGRNCRFVWIGKGYDPENDMGYSVYLADQLRRSGLEQHMSIIDETSSIETAYEVADILLISSRLDPLPNVAIDAMAHGLPVLCFDRTTGIADFLAEDGLAGQCVSPYLDTADMAEKVLALAASEPERRRVGERMKQLVASKFDMSRYVQSLDQIASSAGRSTAGRREFVGEIMDSGVFRPDYFLSQPQHNQRAEDLVEHEYMRSWATGISRRKLFPGFHPGIYTEQCTTAHPDVEPLADFLRSGRPEGPWKYDVISSGEASLPVPAETRVALHLHVYYADMLPDILRRLGLNQIRPDLFVSVPDAQVAADIEDVLKTYAGLVVDAQVVPNRGRDIGPFLTAFGPELVNDYDIVGHLHTKKTVDVKDEAVGRNWHTFLVENLIGGQSCMADTIVGRMAADPSIGMVFPDDPNVIGWSGNLAIAKVIGQRLGVDDYPEHFLFPIGTMFWARIEAIRPLFDLHLAWEDYPPEPIAYDGTMLHALERLFPFVVVAQGGRLALTNVPGITR